MFSSAVLYCRVVFPVTVRRDTSCYQSGICSEYVNCSHDFLCIPNNLNERKQHMTTSKQRKPKRWELYKKEFQIPTLRTDEPIGLYPRQSTKKQKQKNRQSFERQTIDAVEGLIMHGWPRELIRIYDQDMGHSAAQGIEDREAMNQM